MTCIDRRSLHVRQYTARVGTPLGHGDLDMSEPEFTGRLEHSAEDVLEHIISTVLVSPEQHFLILATVTVPNWATLHP